MDSKILKDPDPEHHLCADALAVSASDSLQSDSGYSAASESLRHKKKVSSRPRPRVSVTLSGGYDNEGKEEVLSPSPKLRTQSNNVTSNAIWTVDCAECIHQIACTGHVPVETDALDLWGQSLPSLAASPGTYFSDGSTGSNGSSGDESNSPPRCIIRSKKPTTATATATESTTKSTSIVSSVKSTETKIL